MKLVNGNLAQIILFIQCKFIFQLMSDMYIFNISRISNYGTASTDSAAYILGGFIGQTYPSWRTSTIAQFQNNAWQKIGDLKEIKSDSSAILFHGEYFIIGGSSQYSNGRLVNRLKIICKFSDSFLK